MSVSDHFFELSNKVKIPSVGFGTAPLKGDEAYLAVKTALMQGYRHIDTAQIYQNEDAVGKAIKDSKLPRESLFITSKLDPTVKTYQGAIDKFQASIDALEVEYLDLYLIHAPWPWDDIGSDHKEGNVEAFNAFIDLYEQGKVKSIGVSNFDVEDLDYLMAHVKMAPHVNQIKIHPGHMQDPLVAYCKNHDIVVEAYSPLGRGQIFKDKILEKIADKHQVSIAQVVLRYLLDKSLLPLPRSKNPEHIALNLALDFSLSEEDISTLDALKEPTD